MFIIRVCITQAIRETESMSETKSGSERAISVLFGVGETVFRPDSLSIGNRATLTRWLNFTLTTSLGDVDLLGEMAGGGRYEDLAFGARYRGCPILRKCAGPSPSGGCHGRQPEKAPIR